MWIAIQIMATLVAAEFFLIAGLEIFGNKSKTARQAFALSEEQLNQPVVSTLFVNQGAYNGVIAILILLATYAFPSNIAITILMSSILVVALVGTLTSNWKIIFTQGTLAFVTLVLSVVYYFVA